MNILKVFFMLIPCFIVMNMVNVGEVAAKATFTPPKMLPLGLKGVRYIGRAGFDFSPFLHARRANTYHYVLKRGGGFPPFGLHLGISGRLKGVPRAASERIFGVCAVSLGGKALCRSVKLRVYPNKCTGSYKGRARDTKNSNPFCSYNHVVSGKGTVFITSVKPLAGLMSFRGKDVAVPVRGSFPQCKSARTTLKVAKVPVTIRSGFKSGTVQGTFTANGGTGKYFGRVRATKASVSIPGRLTIVHPVYDKPMRGPMLLRCK